jgi:hypothetical protein
MSTTPKFNHADAARFLRMRYRDDEPAALVLGFTHGIHIPPGGPDRFDAILARAENERQHLFFHVATLKPEWADASTHAKGKVTTARKQHILECPFLWGDCDAEKYEGDDPIEAKRFYADEGRRIDKAIEDQFRKHIIVPAAIWRSGAGWQFLIKLNHALAPELAEDLVARMHVALGFDAVVRNCNRILRVPGSINWKDAEDGRVPAACWPCYFREESHQAVDDMQKAFPQVAESAAGTTQQDDITIDWPQVAGQDVKWLQNLPAAFPYKGRIITEHAGTLPSLCEKLIESKLLVKKYTSWNDVTFALAAVLKSYGQLTPEQMAAVLMADLPCNQHVTVKCKTDNERHRAVERALNRSYVPKAAKRRDFGRRTLIEYDEVDLTHMLDAAETALREQNAPVYQRGGVLVHTYRLNQSDEVDGIKRPADSLGIHEMVPHQLRECIHNYVQFWEPGEDDHQPVKNPIAVPWPVVKHTAARAERWRLRDLRGLLEIPALRPDGSIITEDGYDSATGLLLDKGGIDYPPVPERPTDEEQADALNTLRRPFALFPFVPDDDSIILGSRAALDAPSASRSVTLSGVLTALSRHLMRQAPMHATSAPVMATGKSFIADGTAIIATGRTAAVMNYTGDEAEDEKRLTGVLMQGDTVLSIDNVEKELSGSFLNQLFTQESVQFRVLGQTGQHRLSTAVTVLANGNSLRVAGDMSDRVMMSKLDAGIEKPGEREFRGDFRRDILRQRPELVVAGLTLLRGYIVAGRPWHETNITTRFEDWDHLVRGCLLNLGEPDPYATKDLVASTDSVRESLDALVDALKNLCRESFSAQDLVNHAGHHRGGDLDVALRACVPFGKEPNATNVGLYLQAKRDRIIGEHVLRGAKNSNTKRWMFGLRPVPRVLEPEQGGLF